MGLPLNDDVPLFKSDLSRRRLYTRQLGDWGQFSLDFWHTNHSMNGCLKIFFLRLSQVPILNLERNSVSIVSSLLEISRSLR